MKLEALKPETLTGKKVVLYPDNYLARNLMSLQNSLSFHIAGILAERTVKENPPEDIRDLIRGDLGNCDCLLILEHSPKTLLLPPWTTKSEYYRAILSIASEKNMAIASPFFELSLSGNDYGLRDIVIAKIAHPIDGCDLARLKQLPVMMVTGTRKELNLHSVELGIRETLAKYHFPSFIVSSNPISSLLPFDIAGDFFWAGKDGPKYSSPKPIVIWDGPAQGYPFQTSKGPAPGDEASWDYTERIKPDGVLLVIHSQDSAEMIQESIEYLKCYDLRVVGLIEPASSNPWFRVYVEGKLGIPATAMDSDEMRYQLISIILNAFSDPVQIPHFQVLK